MKEYPYLSQALSQSIELIRRKRKISKVRLADFSCLERRYLREIELGTKKPTVNAIYSICEALDISPIEFFSIVEEERDKLNKSSLLD